MGKKLSVQWAGAEEALEPPVPKWNLGERGRWRVSPWYLWAGAYTRRYMQQDSALEYDSLFNWSIEDVNARAD